MNYNLREYQEMLVVVFGVPFQIARGFKTRRKEIPHNFMTMKLWEVLTEQQFDALYNILHADGVANNESFKLFLNSAVAMNEDLRREKNNEKNKKRYWKNPQAERERNKRYREENKDRINEKGREYYLKNKDKINERQRKYRENNKDKIRERKRKYYLKNKDKIKAKQKEYSENKKEE